MNAQQQRILDFLKEDIRNSEAAIEMYEQGVAHFHVNNEDMTSEVLERERAKVVEAKQLIAAWSLAD